MRFFLIATLVALAVASVPKSFDARSNWPHCDWQILDQGRCGSCWDFSSMEAFGDRACISGEAASGTIMSPEPILECSRDGCNGGNPSVAWNWVISNGDATCTKLCKSGCAPYDSYHGTTPKCNEGKCDSGSKWDKKYTASKFENLAKKDLSLFQKELMNNGPLQACFTEYSNFQPYFDAHPDGIYTETSGNSVGGHCVKLIGWGVSGGTDYWLFANSWAASWGDNGYFKMARGKNLCNIENEMSEGFTSKQAAVLEAQGRVFNQTRAPSSKLGGGWLKQTDVNFDLWVEAAQHGLKVVGEKLHREFVFDKNMDVSTQVVNGLNFNVLAATVDGPKIRMKVFRSPQMEWELVNYDLVF